MPLPDTLDELQAAGYVFKDTGPCRACGAQMAWFLTPNKKLMPFSRKPGGEVPKRFESHHSVCPKREEFRKKATARPRPATGPLEEQSDPDRDDDYGQDSHGGWDPE